MDLNLGGHSIKFSDSFSHQSNVHDLSSYGSISTNFEMNNQKTFKNDLIYILRKIEKLDSKKDVLGVSGSFYSK